MNGRSRMHRSLAIAPSDHAIGLKRPDQTVQSSAYLIRRAVGGPNSTVARIMQTGKRKMIGGRQVNGRQERGRHAAQRIAAGRFNAKHNSLIRGVLDGLVGPAIRKGLRSFRPRSLSSCSAFYRAIRSARGRPCDHRRRCRRRTRRRRTRHLSAYLREAGLR